MGFLNTMGEQAGRSVIEEVRQIEGAEVLVLQGEIDMQSSRELREKFFELTDRSPDSLVVNMEHVSFMDSSGLATLVEALHRCRQANSQLKLVGLCQRVRSIFEISRLLQVFNIYEKEEDALT